MRLNMLSRILSIAVACAAIGATASDVFAQTQQLNKELVRKFPEGDCPLDTPLIGTFVSNTGIIQLTFRVGLGNHGQDVKSGTIETGFNQVLDEISIIEAADFAVNSEPDDITNCYFDSDPHVPVYTRTIPNPAVPFHDSFDAPGPCPWDETDGFTISAGGLHFTGTTDFGSTSVVISGLTPGTQYVLHGRWTAFGFPFATDCAINPDALCMQITIDDLQAGCGPLPVQSTTWGAVKALYKN